MFSTCKVQDGYQKKPKFRRYDILSAILQRPPFSYFGRLPSPPGQPEPYYNAYLWSPIIQQDRTAAILSIGYSQFEGDPRKFRIVCPSDPTIFVIISTHVDDGGKIHNWPPKYAETPYN